MPRYYIYLFPSWYYKMYWFLLMLSPVQDRASKGSCIRGSWVVQTSAKPRATNPAVGGKGRHGRSRPVQAVGCGEGLVRADFCRLDDGSTSGSVPVPLQAIIVHTCYLLRKTSASASMDRMTLRQVYFDWFLWWNGFFLQVWMSISNTHCVYCVLL